VTPSDLPNKPVAEQKVEEPKTPVVKKSSDDEAWVKALEKDTLEGYREYLTLFPDGKHKEDAQAEIDKYDNKAWATAEQRQTLAGYEDYLESWPEDCRRPSHYFSASPRKMPLIGTRQL